MGRKTDWSFHLCPREEAIALQQLYGTKSRDMICFYPIMRNADAILIDSVKTAHPSLLLHKLLEQC